MIKEKESEDGDLDLYGKDFDLYYNQRKVKIYLNKTTREKKNSYPDYQKERGKKRKEVEGRKEKYKDKFKTKFGRKKKKEEKKEEGKESMKEKSKKEEKEKIMDTNAVKFAEVSLCGAARAMQKEVRSVAFWKKFCESEAVVVKFMLVVIMTVCMYMFSVVEKVLEKMVLDSATWQDRYLSGRWQDWTLSQAVGDRRPSRKGLSKANSFREDL